MIPLATTTVLVEAASEPDYSTAAVLTTRGTYPAHISAPSGSERLGQPGVERIDAALLIDTAALVERGDQITDQKTATVYRVAWVADRRGLGLSHLRCGLITSTGGDAA